MFSFHVLQLSFLTVYIGLNGIPNNQSLGRVALISSILCTILGVHLILGLQLALLNVDVLPNDILANYSFWSDDRLQMALQWTTYIVFLCAFHLGEFFTTALFNPSVATADSFMVNHSKAYTTAALVREYRSAIEWLLNYLIICGFVLLYADLMDGIHYSVILLSQNKQFVYISGWVVLCTRGTNMQVMGNGNLW